MLVNNQGTLFRLDATGKELKSFQVCPVALGGLEALSNGHVLLALYNNGMVAEFDAEGKKVWEARMQQPASAVRLPNGNTLVACSFGNQQVVELDRSGNVVWQSNGAPNGRPWRARRR